MTTARTKHRKVPRPPRVFLYLDAVARHGSIRKAAQALNIASSALNRRILDLEEEFGTTLFERLPRGVRLTAAGELFIAYVRRVIGELDLVNSQIEQLRGLLRGRINVGAVESVAGALLPAAVAQFQADHPGVRFHVVIGVPKELTTALVDDRVDLVLTHDPARHRGVTVVTSVRQSLCALMVPDHPLADRMTLRLHDCQDHPVALGDESLAGRTLIEQVLAKSSLRLEPDLVSNSVEMMKAFARLRRGICFQFGAARRAVVPEGGMVAIPLTDAPLTQAQLLLTTRRERILPAAAASFVEQLKVGLESRYQPVAL